MQRIFIKETFPVYVRKRFHPGGKRIVDDEEFKTEARMWLRQQSKDFYAAGFDALVKGYKCISVG
jgi:hypothetical protein